MKTLRKSRRSATLALALATGLLTASLWAPAGLHAQAASSTASSGQAKIKLYSDALEARESGDLVKAKQLFEQLQAIEPTDPGVKQQLAGINADLARQGRGQPTVFGQTAAAAPGTSAAPVATRPATPAATSSNTTAASSSAATTPAAKTATAAAPKGPSDSQLALQAQVVKQKEQLAVVGRNIGQARTLAATGEYDQALDLLTQTQQALPQGLGYDEAQASLTQEKGNILLTEAQNYYIDRKNVQAQEYLDQYVAVMGGSDSRSAAFQAKLAAAKTDPTHQDIDVVSPGFVERTEKIQNLLVRGRAQYLYGDYEGALRSFGSVVIEDPDNIEAKAYEYRINRILMEKAYINRLNTRTAMINDVENQWIRPDVYISNKDVESRDRPDPIMEKLKAIIIPRVNFQDLSLQKVVDTLSELSTDYDKEGKGVNMVIVPTGGPAGFNPNPNVTLLLRDQSLDNILNIICSQNNFTFDVERGVVTLRPGQPGGGTESGFETRDFPMPSATLTRLLGYRGNGGAGGSPAATAGDPFATPSAGTGATPAPSAESAAAGQPSSNEVEDGLKNFFQKAGVAFPQGSSLAFDGSKIWVTNKPNSLNRLFNLLRRYSEIKQVEVESRFLDVSQGVLQELGFRWFAKGPNGGRTTLGTGDTAQNNVLRLTDNAFAVGRSGAQPTVVATTSVDPTTGQQTTGGFIIPQTIPSLPNAINTGAGMSSLFNGVLGIIDGWTLNLTLNALDQTQGADLMSAPKVTVLSQKTAEIVVAQQLRYPTAFSDTSSQVGTGNQNGGGSAGVTITAGTPSDFQTEEVGVVMEVTPTVEDDDSISLRLEPRVTEFEGFIEYGGTSIAISSGTTVTVPSGFIQPVFSIRQVRTEVTIFDGATVVIGGLTREEVKTVHDSVPVLGSIPFIGRLFQSKGETSQKRNLMIFVTANLISPGGSPARQALPGLPAGTLFQNPSIVTPARATRRNSVEPPPPPTTEVSPTTPAPAASAPAASSGASPAASTAPITPSATVAATR